MYTFPIKLEFPMISLGRQVTVTDATGKFIMRVKDPFFSFKDTMPVTDASGNLLYNFNGDTSFRFMFQIASMSTAWNLQTPDGGQVFRIDDFYVKMEEFQSMNVKAPKTSPMNSDGTASLGGIAGNIAGNFAANAVHSQVNRHMPRRLVYQIVDKEENRNAMGWIVPSRGTAWFDFLPYSTRIQILKIPFVARAYAPSYEFKLGSLSSPAVLTLKKQRDLFIDRYVLEKTATLSEVDEKWAIPAMAMATLFEQTRLKNIADW